VSYRLACWCGFPRPPSLYALLSQWPGSVRIPPSNFFKQMTESRSERSYGDEKYRDEEIREKEARAKAAASHGRDGVV